VKFARHLAAALLAVAVVIALGVAWEHSSAARVIAPPVPAAGGPGFRKLERAPPLKASHGNVQVIRVRGGTRVVHVPAESAGLDVSDLQNLTRTAEIEAAIAAAVVALSLIRRTRRRARARAWLRTAGPTAAAGPPPGPEPAD
jgi:hypothetical protein